MCFFANHNLWRKAILLGLAPKKSKLSGFPYELFFPFAKSFCRFLSFSSAIDGWCEKITHPRRQIQKFCLLYVRSVWGSRIILMLIWFIGARWSEKKAYASKKRVSWIKFLMKMFSRGCCIYYRWGSQKETEWKDVWLICFRMKKLKKVLKVKSFALETEKIIKPRRKVYERLHIAFSESSEAIKFVHSCTWNCVENCLSVMHVKHYLNFIWVSFSWATIRRIVNG